MAGILERYGIKEVADLTFYKIDNNGQPSYPVLYVDTAKVSTIETTAEQVDARGGKGNPKLITWDYGKEINVTIEDALFSARSMAMVFGDENPATATSGDTGAVTLSRSVNYRPSENIDTSTTTLYATKESGGARFTVSSVGTNGHAITWYDAATNSTVTSLSKGERYIGVYSVTPDFSTTIEVNAETFPGTYYVTGDTWARSDVNGEDQFFQFIIHKAKMSSETTLTLEAEGDPTVFNMNLVVLRPESGPMMELVQYVINDPQG